MKMNAKKTRAFELKVRTYLGYAGITADRFKRLLDIGYLEKPASIGHHLAVRGGLLMHSVNVTDWLVRLGKAMDVPWTAPRSPYVVGMLHDVCKCMLYHESGTAAGTWERREIPWPGHGVASALIVPEVLGVHLDAQETAAIVWHMGAFRLGPDELRQYDAALRRFPQAIIATHTADMTASRVTEADE